MHFPSFLFDSYWEEPFAWILLSLLCHSGRKKNQHSGLYLIQNIGQKKDLCKSSALETLCLHCRSFVIKGDLYYYLEFHNFGETFLGINGVFCGIQCYDVNCPLISLPKIGKEFINALILFFLNHF